MSFINTLKRNSIAWKLTSTSNPTLPLPVLWSSLAFHTFVRRSQAYQFLHNNIARTHSTCSTVPSKGCWSESFCWSRHHKFTPPNPTRWILFQPVVSIDALEFIPTSLSSWRWWHCIWSPAINPAPWTERVPHSGHHDGDWCLRCRGWSILSRKEPWLTWTWMWWDLIISLALWLLSPSMSSFLRLRRGVGERIWIGDMNWL